MLSPSEDDDDVLTMVSFRAFCMFSQSSFKPEDPSVEAPVIATIREVGLPWRLWQCALAHVVRDFSLENRNSVIDLLELQAEHPPHPARPEPTAPILTWRSLSEALICTFQMDEPADRLVSAHETVDRTISQTSCGYRALRLPESLDGILHFCDFLDRTVVGTACRMWHRVAMCHASSFRGPVESWWNEVTGHMNMSTGTPNNAPMESRKQALRLVACVQTITRIFPVLLARLHQVRTLKKWAIKTRSDGCLPEIIEFEMRARLMDKICSELRIKLEECQRVYRSVDYRHTRGHGMDIWLTCLLFSKVGEFVRKCSSALMEHTAV